MPTQGYPSSKPPLIILHHELLFSTRSFPSPKRYYLLISYNLLFFINFIYFNVFFLGGAALGVHCCVRAFSSCGEQGLLFVAAHGLLIAVASLVAEHGL